MDGRTGMEAFEDCGRLDEVPATEGAREAPIDATQLDMRAAVKRVLHGIGLIRTGTGRPSTMR